jgi:hypothetical protein
VLEPALRPEGDVVVGPGPTTCEELVQPAAPIEPTPRLATRNMDLVNRWLAPIALPEAETTQY